MAKRQEPVVGISSLSQPRRGRYRCRPALVDRAMDRDEGQALPERPLRVLVLAGSARRVNGCPGLDAKARALIHRMVGRLPPGWQLDTEDIGNEHGRPKIQTCNR